MWWRGLIHSKGARKAAASTPEAARPALMTRAAHAVKSKAVVCIEVAVSPAWALVAGQRATRAEAPPLAPFAWQGEVSQWRSA
jgi:hypothetical protein